HADLAGAVAVAVAAPDLSPIGRLQRLPRPPGPPAGPPARGPDAARPAHARVAGRRPHVVEAPAVAGPDVHVLDQPQDVARAAEMLGHLEEAAVVQPPLHDHVHLDGPEPGGPGPPRA